MMQKSVQKRSPLPTLSTFEGHEYFFEDNDVLTS